MSLPTASAPADLVPPADALRAQIATINPSLRAVMAYISAIDSLHDADATTTMEGMTITLPNPFKEFPEVGAALRRAKGRSSVYGAGNMQYFHWIISVVQYGSIFDHAAGQILEQYKVIPAAGPSPAQRTAVLTAFDSLLRPLKTSRDQLVTAEESFLKAHSLLEEDKGALSEGAPAMNRVIQRYEERIRDEMIKLSLYPTTRGLAAIMGKAGGAQLDHLRRMRSSIGGATAACTKAHADLSLLAGRLLTLIGQYQGMEAALKTAEGDAFVKYINSMQLSIARQTWTALAAYAMDTMKG